MWSPNSCFKLATDFNSFLTLCINQCFQKTVRKEVGENADSCRECAAWAMLSSQAVSWVICSSMCSVLQRAPGRAVLNDMLSLSAES